MKKISIIFLSFVIFIAPPLAYAGVGKYIIDIVKQTPNAVKVSATNTATGAKHIINHGVSSRDLATAIGGGLVSMALTGGLGLAFEAITGLALDAVDWVMDEENNQIKWKHKGDAGDGSTSEPYIWRYKSTTFGDRDFPYSTSPESVCSGLLSLTTGKLPWKYDIVSVSSKSASNISCYLTSTTTSFDGSDSVYRVPNPNYKPPDTTPIGWQTIPLETLAKKTIDLAKQGKAPAVKTIQDYVTNIAKNGDLDRELDNSTDITKSDKECSAGYEKVGKICVKKNDKDDEECPAGTIKVGEYCMKEPDDSDGSSNTDPAQCGECCEELQLILITMSQMNNDFYINSLDNDAQMLVNLKLVNDQLDAIATDFSELLAEAKKTNQTLTEINNNQELHFNELKQKADELKQAVDTGNADILAKLAEMQVAIDLTNLKLDQVNLNLDKINENLEKMQKCEETEFNKKICDFIDWVQSEPSETTSEPVEVKEIEAENSNKINMSGECPAPYQLNFAVLGYAQNNSISYQPLCDALTMLKPIFVGSGALSGMFILMGYSRPSGTGVN